MMMFLRLLLLCTLLLVPATLCRADVSDKWSPLRSLLTDWLFTENFAVSVGTAEAGQVFLFEKGVCDQPPCFASRTA